MCEHLSRSESTQALMEPPKAMPCRGAPPLLPHRTGGGGGGGGGNLREHMRRTPFTTPKRTCPSEGGGSDREAAQGAQLPKKPRRKGEGPETHREGRSLKGEQRRPQKGGQVKNFPLRHRPIHTMLQGTEIWVFN